MRRRMFSRPSPIGPLALALLLAASWAVHPSAAAEPGSPRAELAGRPIELHAVGGFHCHDLAHPLIRCFETAAERDADLAQTLAAPEAEADAESATIPWVRWYRDANYGGPSFAASISYPDLGALGWNDAISSFATYSGAHPRWYEHVGYGGIAWDWGTASVAYVGDAANDRFSSVELL